MSRETVTLADGTTPIAPVMNRAQVEIAYPAFPKEIHTLVDRLLESPEDRIVAIHDLVDTPALAVQSLAVCIGSRLPVYDYDGSSRGPQVGETKQIERADTFALAEGPIVSGNRMDGFKMATILKRVVTHEPVEDLEPARDLSMFRKLLQMSSR